MKQVLVTGSKLKERQCSYFLHPLAQSILDLVEKDASEVSISCGSGQERNLYPTMSSAETLAAYPATHNVQTQHIKWAIFSLNSVSSLISPLNTSLIRHSQLSTA